MVNQKGCQPLDYAGPLALPQPCAGHAATSDSALVTPRFCSHNERKLAARTMLDIEEQVSLAVRNKDNGSLCEQDRFAAREGQVLQYTTDFGSLANYKKGGVIPIAEDPKRFVFSNLFEVANKSAAWERVVIGKNFEYTIEVARAEGTSPWYTAAHD
jgi:hypothetical protein